jgi:hypothetical protein
MSSHASAPATTSLLTVLAVALVHRERPDWLAIGVGDAARAVDLSPERVSRLATRAIEPFRDIVDKLTRRGRPPRTPSDDVARTELQRLRALLTVASAALALVPLHKPAVRALIIGAWRRLSIELPSLTKSAFCKALALPDRTLRDWLARASRSSMAPSVAPPSPKRPSRKRPTRRPRFRFDVFVPGTQIGADTTDIDAFGVRLKLVGVQDIGGRDRSLFESVVIDTRESSDHVIDAFRAVLRDCPGVQAITDQGTPYIAEATRLELDRLEAEHAPQKEGDPTGKSTVEKGFDSLKRILEPLLALSGSLAELVPQLRSPDLAIPFARLTVGTVLRAYQAGARAAHRAFDASGGASEDALVRAAARAREVARADDRSARLLLAHLHDLFRFEASCSAFMQRFRRYPLDVLRSAEAALRKRLLLCDAPDIRCVDRYFAALVRSSFAEHRSLRTAREASRSLGERLGREDRDDRAARRAHLADPARWLMDALNLLAMHWLPRERALLFDGDGLGIAWMRGALTTLFSHHAETSAADLAAGVFDDFCRAHRPSLGDDGCTAVANILQREIARVRARPPTLLADDPPRAIPDAIGLFMRSIVPSPLSN